MVLSRKLRDEIVAHARTAAPQECCGLLLGEDEVVRRVLRCQNVHPTPETRYLIDGKEVETLAGHVDLRQPLAKNMGLVQ